MRHVIGLILGIVLTPALLVGVGWSGQQLYMSYTRFDTGWTRLVVPLLVILLCGTIYALLIGSRISPLASFLVGLGFLALQVLSLIPAGLGFLLSFNQPIGNGLSTLAVTGAALLLALVGILPIAMPNQWARRHRPAATGGGSGGYGGPPQPYGNPTGPGGAPLVGAGTAQTDSPDTLRLPGSYDGENTVNWPPQGGPPR
jgi:hypothetical protein